MLLYPRLRTIDAKPFLELWPIATLDELEAEHDLMPRGLVWAPTGGTRIRPEQLQELRSLIRAIATECGYEYGTSDRPDIPREQRQALDRMLAPVLHTRLMMSPNEAADPGVWRYMACIIAPELVRWRFDGESTSGERFGGNRVRNLFSRLWWRAELLRDEEGTNPWHLLENLGEDEQVQLTERANVAGYRPLAVGIGRALLKLFDPSLAVGRMKLMREAMKRVLRRLPLIRYESFDGQDLEGAVEEIFNETIQGLGYDRPRAQLSMFNRHARSAASRAGTLAGRSWRETPLDRRHQIIAELNPEEINRLARLAFGKRSVPSDPDFRWELQYGLHTTINDVVACLAPETVIRVGARTGTPDLVAWLSQRTCSSWAREVPPEKGELLLALLDPAWLRTYRTRLGWGEPPAGDDELRCELLRRFGGDWEDIIGWLDDEQCKRLIQELDPGLPLAEQGTEPRSAVGSWLVSRRVDVAKRGRMTWPRPSQVRSGADRPPQGKSSPAIPPPSKGLHARPSGLRPYTPQAGRAISGGGIAEEGVLYAARTQERDRTEGFSGMDEAVTPVAERVISSPAGGEILPEPPSLISALLLKLKVRTRDDLRALDLTSLRKMPGVGPRKLDELTVWRDQLLVGARPVTRADSPIKQALKQLPVPKGNGARPTARANSPIKQSPKQPPVSKGNGARSVTRADSPIKQAPKRPPVSKGNASEQVPVVDKGKRRVGSTVSAKIAGKKSPVIPGTWGAEEPHDAPFALKPLLERLEVRTIRAVLALKPDVLIEKGRATHYQARLLLEYQVRLLKEVPSTS